MSEENMVTGSTGEIVEALPITGSTENDPLREIALQLTELKQQKEEPMVSPHVVKELQLIQEKKKILTKDSLAHFLQEGALSIEEAGREYLGLDEKEIVFIEHYIRLINSGVGNTDAGIAAACRAYDLNNLIKQQLEQAKRIKKNLLTNGKVILLISASTQATGLNPSVAESSLKSIMMQRDNIPAALGAVRLYSELVDLKNNEANESETLDYTLLSTDELVTFIKLYERMRIASGEQSFNIEAIIKNEIDFNEDDKGIESLQLVDTAADIKNETEDILSYVCA